MNNTTALRRQRIIEDKELSDEQLDDKYNQEGDGEHPDFPRSNWREMVAQKDTISGYWSWVMHVLNEEFENLPNEQ